MYYHIIHYFIILFLSWHIYIIIVFILFTFLLFIFLKPYYPKNLSYPLYILYDDYTSIDSSRTCLFSVKTYGSKCKMTSSSRRGASIIIFAAWCFYRSSSSSRSFHDIVKKWSLIWSMTSSSWRCGALIVLLLDFSKISMLISYFIIIINSKF